MADNDRGLFGAHEKALGVSWVSILVPAIVLLSIAAIVVVAIIRRRNRLARNGLSLDSQGRSALERDMLEHGLSRSNGDGHTDLAGGQDSRLPRTANRWAWANAANASSTPGGGNCRREEGLNEFGEAPPPYEPPSSISPILAGTVLQEEPESGPAIAMPEQIHTSTRNREEATASPPAPIPSNVSAMPAALPQIYSTDARLLVEAK